MMSFPNESQLKQFFNEIYDLLKNSDANITEKWCEISEINSFKKFNSFELKEMTRNFEFISIAKGNYRDYVVINKILFITNCFRHLQLDIRELINIIDYSGFEALIEEILIRNNYTTIKNFRFSDKSYFKIKTSQNRYEIDIIGIHQNYVLIVDAKQWNRKDSYSALNKAANLQFQRAIALKSNPEVFSNLYQSLIGMGCNYKKILPITLIPLMVTLEDNWIRFNENSIPLVSISNFNSFLQELNVNMNHFRTIKINKINIQKQLF